jgi:hypothetical protein
MEGVVLTRCGILRELSHEKGDIQVHVFFFNIH